jgi:hypothetical protein
MPFIYHGRLVYSDSDRSFEETDRVIIERVFPNVKWIREIPGIKRAVLLPNRYYYPKERGRTLDKNPEDYFVLSCLEKGLSLDSIGLWLDICIERFQGVNSDGITRRIYADKESVLRFDRRKVIYYFKGIARGKITVDER